MEIWDSSSKAVIDGQKKNVMVADDWDETIAGRIEREERECKEYGTWQGVG